MRWYLALDDSHLLDIVLLVENLASEKSICRMQLQQKPTEITMNDVALHWKPQSRTALQYSKHPRSGWDIEAFSSCCQEMINLSVRPSIWMDTVIIYAAFKGTALVIPHPCQYRLQSSKGLVKSWYSSKRHLQFYLEFVICCFISGWYPACT